MANANNIQILHSSVKFSVCETSWKCEQLKTLQIFPLIPKHECQTTHRETLADRLTEQHYEATTTVTQRDAEVEEDVEWFFFHMREADIYLPQFLCSQSKSNIRRRSRPGAVQQGFSAPIGNQDRPESHT